jgi:hypothetical protein
MKRFRRQPANNMLGKDVEKAQKVASGELPKNELSRQRLWLFRLVCVSLPLLALVLVELAFRVIPSLSEDRDPDVNISPFAIFSRSKDAATGEEYYNVTYQRVLNAGSVHIPVKKPANDIRIFCLGSSACASWPHPASETFSAYLQQALQTAYPGKQVEVINVAAHGFAAYRTRRVLDEVLTLQPDAVLVWEGNNEFLEERNYDRRNAVITYLARHLRTVQWLQATLLNRNQMSGQELKGEARFFAQKIHQQSLKLREDPVQFAGVQAHFDESFEHMVSQAQRHQVPIVLCTVPVNLRDWLPTVSCNRLSGEKLERWQLLFNQARRCLIEGIYRDGVQAINQAIAMESEHAESYFWLGRLLEADGQTGAAREALSKARDQDYNPFRAISSFNDAIRALARKNQSHGVYLLDLDHIFIGASRYAAPGFDLFLDYVHPTKPGNLLVAKSAFELITRNGVLNDKPAVEQFIYNDVAGPNGKPYRDEDDKNLQFEAHYMALENHQYEAVAKRIEDYVVERTGHRPTAGPDDPLCACLSPELAQRYRAVWEYLEAQRRVILNPSVDKGQLQAAKRRLDDYYEKQFPPGKY